MTPAELRADPWAFGPWCWVVDQVELFELPFPCRGMQGLWPVEGGMVEALDGLVGWDGPRARDWSALTLLQPYASAIASGHKRIENRPWRRTIPPGGLWVGLHAGAALYDRFDAVMPYRFCRRTREEQVREHVDHQLDVWRSPMAPVFGQPGWPDAPTSSELPRGVMLGAMHFTACLPYPTEETEAHPDLFGSWATR